MTTINGTRARFRSGRAVASLLLPLLVTVAAAPPALAQPAQPTAKPAQPQPPGPAAKPGTAPPGGPAAKPGAAAPAPAPAPAAAPAAPPAAPSLGETLSGEAKSDYESGKLLFTDGDNAGALVKFKSAYDKSKDARLLWNMAACEKNLRHYSRSLKLVRQYLSEGSDKLTDQDKSEAQDLIKIMEPLTARLKLSINEPGADVFIDEEPIGKSPIDAVVVDIGTRKLRVHKDEFEDHVRDVAIEGNADVMLEVKLAKIVHEGRLNVRTNSDASIAVDGKIVGKGMWSGTLASGGHAIAISAPKMRAYQSEVYIQDKEARDVNVTLEAEPSKGLPTWVWIAGGAVLVGGATTAGILLFRSDPAYEGPPGNLQPGVIQASRPIQF